jgi:RNA ligase
MSYQALAQIRREVEAGNVSERQLEGTFLSIFKYTQHCVMENAWNAVNRRCRGIVFDTFTGTIVARPFDKFFNLGELPETSIHEVLQRAKIGGFRVTEKMDGSMCSVFNYAGKWMCATPGSISSEQALYATANLLPKYDLSHIPIDVTLVCEMISPMDRKSKVVLYGDRDELVLLAAFESRWEQVEIPTGRVISFAVQSGIPLVPVRTANCNNLTSLDIPENVEGYVIAFEDGLRVKVKSFEYLRAFRLICEFSQKHILDYIETGEYREAVKFLPEEHRKHFDDIFGQVMTIKGQLELDVQEWYNKCDRIDMKKSAQILEAAGPIKGLVFMMLRDKTEEQMKMLLWKLIRARFGERN